MSRACPRRRPPTVRRLLCRARRFKLIRETPPALGPGEVNPFEHGDPGSSTHATKPLQLGGGEASSSASAWNNLTQGGN